MEEERVAHGAGGLSVLPSLLPSLRPFFPPFSSSRLTLPVLPPPPPLPFFPPR
jgi:hypothetical protein